MYNIHFYFTTSGRQSVRKKRKLIVIVINCPVFVREWSSSPFNNVGNR